MTDTTLTAPPATVPLAEPIADRVPVPVPTVDRKGPSALSPSGTGKYHNCPLSYYLNNVAKIPEPTGEPAVIGTFAHRVLENLMARPPAERTVDVARELARQAWQVITCGADALDGDPDEDEIRSAVSDCADYLSLGLDEEQAKAFRWKAWRAVESYFRIENPAAVQVVSVEQRISGTVAGVPARGIIDRLERVNGALVVGDYKTGRAPRLGAAHWRLPQLATYARLVEAVFGELPTKLRLIHLNQHPHDPSLDGTADQQGVIIEVAASPSMLGKADKWLNDAWDGIYTDMDRGAFDATPNRLCDWCHHRPNCPAWGGDVGVALLSAAKPGETALPFP